MLMQNQLGTLVSIEAIAHEIGLSTSQLERVFAADFGMSPTAYLVELRLTQFGRLMRDTRLTVTEAAQSVGWRSGQSRGEHLPATHRPHPNPVPKRACRP